MPKAKRPLKAFLCHASQDKPAVRDLYETLKSEGWIDPWLDKAKILPGQDWRIVIERAVEESDVVVVCLSTQSVSKEGFVQREIKYAYDIALEKPEETIFLIPLRLDDCTVPRGLRSLHWVDYFGSERTNAYSDLLQALKLRYEQKLRLEEEERAHQEKEEQEREAKIRAEQEAAEKLAKEKTAREKAAKDAKEKAERDAAEKAAREKAEKEATEKAAKEKAERETAEKIAQEKTRLEAEEQARQKAAKEKTEREMAEREYIEQDTAGKAVREKAEHENVRDKVAEEKHYSKPEPTKEKDPVSGILPFNLKPQVIVALIVVIGIVAAILFSSFNSPNQAKNTFDPTSVNPTLAPNSAVQTPIVVQGKFKVAMVSFGSHDDGGWSQAHYEGLMYVADNVPNVEVTYKENIPEGADSEKVFRDLANEGFNLILSTSFGYMDTMEKVASEFPNVMFINIEGFKSNVKNFGNLNGAMEDMQYLAGMVAGARAKADGNPKLGFIATFPIPEEIRLGNAIALGMKKTCPECTMDVRWVNTWHDPAIEKEAATSLFDAGAQVVFTGTDTPAVADVAQEKGKWGVTHGWYGSCIVERCLTAPYWVWGPIYAKITVETIAGIYKPGWDYYDADTGGLGLYGFMEGQELTSGVADLDPAVVQQVRDILSQMLAGEFTRFDIFTGPINDNKGNVVLLAGQSLQQVDLDFFPESGLPCSIDVCMKWWAEGITAELP